MLPEGSHCTLWDFRGVPWNALDTLWDAHGCAMGLPKGSRNRSPFTAGSHNISWDPMEITMGSHVPWVVPGDSMVVLARPHGIP